MGMFGASVKGMLGGGSKSMTQMRKPSPSGSGAIGPSNQMMRQMSSGSKFGSPQQMSNTGARMGPVKKVKKFGGF